jgi:hypothetical protein
MAEAADVMAGAVLQALFVAWGRAASLSFASFACPAWNTPEVWPCDWCGCATDVVSAAGCYCSERCEVLATNLHQLAGNPVPEPVRRLLECTGGAGLRPAAEGALHRLAAAAAAEQRLAADQPGVVDGMLPLLSTALSPEGAWLWLWAPRAEWQGRSALEMLESPLGSDEVICHLERVIESGQP